MNIQGCGLLPEGLDVVGILSWVWKMCTTEQAWAPFLPLRGK